MDHPASPPGTPTMPALELSRRQLIQASAATIGALSALPAAGDAAAACRPAPAPGTAPLPATVSGYVLARLHQHGCDTLFTVPAATCDRLLEAAAGGPVATVVTSSDLEAGYAADGYARIKGLGAVSVSYGPGILSMINAIAGAWVERSPVVIINGGPSAGDLSNQSDLGILFSHSAGTADLDRSLFRDITAAHERASTAAAVPMVVDRAITAALRLKRPVYIEIASSLWREALPLPTGGRLDAPVPLNTAARTAARQAAVAIRDRVRAGARPALLLGEEIARRGLSADAAALVLKTGLPWATTLLGKGAIAEATPRFSGVHDGRRSPSRANAVLDRADVLIGLGCVLSLDHLTLVQDGRIDRLTLAVDGTLRTGRGRRTAVDFSGLLAELGQLDWPARADWSAAIAGPEPQPEPANSEAGLRHDEVFAEIRRTMNDQASRGTVLVADTNLSTHPAADVALGARDGFVCGAAWKSIGHSLGVALGIATAGGRPRHGAGDRQRPLRGRAADREPPLLHGGLRLARLSRPQPVELRRRCARHGCAARR
jgi:indolepyruvate decarboxylase